MVLVLILGGCVIFYFLFGNKLVCNSSNSQQEEQQKTENETNENNDSTYTGWKTYTNANFDLSFKYPSDWTVGISDDGVSLGIQPSADSNSTGEPMQFVDIEKIPNEKLDEYIKQYKTDISSTMSSVTVGTKSISPFQYAKTTMWNKDAYVYTLLNGYGNFGYMVESNGNVYDIRFLDSTDQSTVADILKSITFNN